jgi:SET family sugar efflux transporter-like MFS transporter
LQSRRTEPNDNHASDIRTIRQFVPERVTIDLSPGVFVMTSTLLIAFRHPVVRLSMIAIFLFGFTGAATSPYQSVIGITELGLSDGFYSILIFAAAAVNVTASLWVGVLADRIGNYRILLMTVMMFGVVGYGLVYALPVAASFVICTLIILPVYNAMNSLLFANVRAVANASGGRDAAAINSGVRAAISVAWVLVPGLVALVLAGSGSMLPAYLLACLGCTANLALVYFKLPAGGAPPPISHRHSYLASFTEVLSPKVFARLMAVSLITSTLHVNAAVQPLIITGTVGGKVTDIGAVVGIVAFLEIVFIFAWARMLLHLHPVTALAAATGLYVVYLALLGFSSAPWQIYALTPLSAFAAAALISIPITYIQDLIADRPGLGSSLISVNLFLSGGLSAVLFALGTRFSDYSGTSLLGALAGMLGLALLIYLDGRHTARPSAC